MTDVARRTTSWIRTGRARESGIIATLTLVYIGVLYYLMIQYIAPTYSYRGFTYRTPDGLMNAVVISATVVLALLMPRRIDKASSVVVWMHFVFATMPSMLVPQFTASLSKGLAFQLALVIAGVWLVVLSALSSRKVSALLDRLAAVAPAIPRPGWSRRRWTSVLSAVAVVVMVLMVAIFGLSGHLPWLTHVRDVRLSYRAALAAAPPGTAYLVLWSGYVLNPLVIMRGLMEKRWIPILVGVLAQGIIYGTAGYKMVALSVPAVLVLYAWTTRPSLPHARDFLGAVVTLMVIAWGAFVTLGSSTLSLLFVLRMVVTPGNLAAAYVSIFHDRDQLFWSYSFMSRFVHYPYDLHPNFLVGGLFRHDPASSANVNMFGDGYMSMRWGGILLESLVLVGLLLLLDRVSARLPFGEVAAILLLPSFALCNSNVFTAFLTDGFLPAIVLFCLLSPSARVEPPRHDELRAGWLWPWQRDKQGRSDGRLEVPDASTGPKTSAGS